VRVRPVGVSWPPGWVEVNAIPSMPSTRAVKDGGWLAIDPAQDLLYCGKGYKTGDFYSRPVLGSTWTQLTLIPNGVEAKPPYKGAVGCADGFGHVYLTKGNNTQGFWRYVADSLVWRQLAPVPMGISGKRVKGGTDVVFVMHGDTGYVYLLKGYKQDFFRYNTRTGVWDTTLPLAPAGAKAKWDKGSWLVYDEAGRLYAHKAKYHEMWTFDLSGRSWSATPLPGMPFVGGMGRTKKSKDGGCGAWFDGSIFALKGGNTQEYWQFSSGPGTWTELETIPAFGSTGRKKRVKAGGDIVYSTYALWALKGNKTLEFWRYGLLLTAAAPRPERAGVMAGPGHAAGRAAVAPSVVADGRLKLLVSGSGPAVLTLYDAAGRVAFNRSVVLQGPVISVDVGSLPAGVYLARLDTEAGATTRTKVVLR
jgi:hypothetical protein